MSRLTITIDYDESAVLMALDPGGDTTAADAIFASLTSQLDYDGVPTEIRMSVTTDTDKAATLIGQVANTLRDLRNGDPGAYADIELLWTAMSQCELNAERALDALGVVR